MKVLQQERLLKEQGSSLRKKEKKKGVVGSLFKNMFAGKSMKSGSLIKETKYDQEQEINSD